MNAQGAARFLKEQNLPDSYLATLEERVAPLGERVAALQSRLGRPILVAINGCQGSGKSTWAAALEWLMRDNHSLNAVALSLDDFYLTRAERDELSRKVHPLLATRGVPGTHDMDLLGSVLNQLLSGSGNTLIPRFDKAIDDRVDSACWQTVATPIQVVLLEGWCLGVESEEDETLLAPVNALESSQDEQCIWRRYVNDNITKHYTKLFDRSDLRVMLKAPSFECVHGWRLEQEQKLSARRSSPVEDCALMSSEEILQFIQFYQRHTIQLLQNLPKHVHVLFHMNLQREIVEVQYPVALCAQADNEESSKP